MKWKLMRFKRFLNIFKKVSFQFPIWKLPELKGEGLFIFFFFPQDPFEIFCYCDFALENPQRVYSQMFSHTPLGTDPREFSHPPSPRSVPWHRLMQGLNPISWTGLSWSYSFLQHQLSGSGGLCHRLCLCCGQGCVEAAVAPAPSHKPANVVHPPSSGPKGLYICSCRYTFFPCLLFGFTPFIKPVGWSSCISFSWGHVYLSPMKWFFPVSSCESS